MNFDDHNEPKGPWTYAQAIAEDTGCAPDDVARIEILMRDEHRGVLDNLGPARFAAEARRCHRFLLALREMAKDPAASVEALGWTRAEFDACCERYLKGGA